MKKLNITVAKNEPRRFFSNLFWVCNLMAFELPLHLKFYLRVRVNNKFDCSSLCKVFLGMQTPKSNCPLHEVVLLIYAFINLSEKESDTSIACSHKWSCKAWNSSHVEALTKKVKKFTFQGNFGYEQSSASKVCVWTTGGVNMLNYHVHMHMETMRTIPGVFIVLFSVRAKRCHASFYRRALLSCNVHEF